MAKLFWKFLGLFGIKDYSAIDEVTRVAQVMRGLYEVREGGRSARIFVAEETGDPLIIVDGYTPRSWKPPHDKEEFTEEDRDRILSKLGMYFERCGWAYEISYRSLYIPPSRRGGPSK